MAGRSSATPAATTPASCKPTSARRAGKSPPPAAAAAGGLFSPQTKGLGIERGELSPSLQRKVVRAGTKNTSFAKGSEDLLDYLQLRVCPKQVERLTRRVGQQRCARRDLEVERYLSLPLAQRKGKPEGVVPPDLAVVGVDGGRLQVRPAAAPAAAGSDEELPPDEKDRGKHWREDKIGLLMTMTSAARADDPCPAVPAAFVDPTRIAKLARQLRTKRAARQEAAEEAPAPEEAAAALGEAAAAGQWSPPQVQQRHLSATRRPWAALGPMVAALAWRHGFYRAPRQAFVGDGADNVWAVWRDHFSSFVPILDIIHAISYLFASATAGRPFAEGWACYVRWMSWAWQGEVQKVVAELAQRQAELGVPPEGEGETHPARVVNTALGYLQKHKDKMRYPEYRRQGLPITSSYVESAVKQFNYRLKGTEKFWSEAGAEAVLQLRADYLGSDGAVAAFWQDRQENATGLRRYELAA